MGSLFRIAFLVVAITLSFRALGQWQDNNDLLCLLENPPQGGDSDTVCFDNAQWRDRSRTSLTIYALHSHVLLRENPEVLAEKCVSADCTCSSSAPWDTLQWRTDVRAKINNHNALLAYDNSGSPSLSTQPLCAELLPASEYLWHVYRGRTSIPAGSQPFLDSNLELAYLLDSKSDPMDIRGLISFNQANDYLNEGETRLAEQAFLASTEALPQSDLRNKSALTGSAYINLALLSLEAGDVEQSTQYFAQSVEANPEFALQLAKLYFDDLFAYQHSLSGDRLFQLIDESDDPNQTVSAGIVIGLLIAGQNELADELIAHMDEQTNDAESYAPLMFLWQEAESNWRAELNDDFLQLVETVIGEKPNVASAWFLEWSRWRDAEGDLESAIEAQQLVTEFSPQQIGQWERLLRLLAKAGRWDELRSTIDEAIKLNPDRENFQSLRDFEAGSE